MAADQRRKRLNSASSSWDHYRAKKKKLGSQENDRNMKSHISLEWDDNQKKVVAKTEQIGICWRSLKPFRETVPRYHNVLATVISVPREIFELENLTDVLSYEVWQTHLSESERNHLMQFLPGEPDVQQGLQALLAGDNLHFGNPFLKWGAALCSGNLHPDSIIHQELCLKSDNKVYHAELSEYHENLIKCFHEGKERCANSEDPEKEIAQMWRSRTDVDKMVSKEDRFHNFEENAATSESCSWFEDEKAYSSDNQNSSVMKGGELERRTSQKSVLKDKSRNQFLTSDDAHNEAAVRTRKGDKQLKRNINCSDGAKYMSYFKISKKQHELVKSMKQIGKSIQSRSLNHVLGNLDSFHVQSYEVFEEEEKKKLHEHWLQLVQQDLPAAYANWRERQSQIQKIIKLLEQDMKNKLIFSNDEETLENEMQNQTDARLVADGSIVQDGEESFPMSPQKLAPHQIPSPNGDLNDMDMNSGSNHSLSKSDDGEESISMSQQNQAPQQIPSLDDNHNHINLVSESNHILSKSDDCPQDESEHSGNLNATNIIVTQEIPLLSQCDAWQTNDMPHSFYGSTAGHEYSSSSGLVLELPQVNKELHAHLVGLETDLHKKDVIHRQSGNVSFSSYPNQDRNGLLQSLFKGQGMMSCHPEQKTVGLDFQTPNVLMEDGPFPRHFQQPLQPPPQPLLQLEHVQGRRNQVYMEQQNIADNIYSDGGRYFIPRQEHLPPAPVPNVQDWAVNPIHMPAPLQSHLNGGGLLSQNWISGDQQVRGGWAVPDGASVRSQNIGSVSNADQNLYSVLSHCNPLRSSAPYDSGRSTEQFIPQRNYGMLNGVTARMNNVLPQTANPLDYLSGREAASAAAPSLMTDEMVWMSMPQQNSALHDSMGKPFLRRWNQ